MQFISYIYIEKTLTKGSLRIPSTECWNGSVGGDLTIYHEVAGEQVETKVAMKKEKPGAPSNFDKKIRTFADACKNGTAAPVPSSEILYNQAILDGIAKSNAAGKEIELNVPSFDEI